MYRPHSILGVAFVSSFLLATTADPGATRAEPGATAADPGAAPHDIVQPKAPFTLHFGDESSSLETVSTFLLPGEWLDVRVETLGSASERASFTVETDQRGVLEPGSDRSWRWQAPAAPGLYPLWVRQDGPVAGAPNAKRLNAFVMVPASEVRRGAINGYTIGDYPDQPLNGKAIYEKPKGFIEVTPEMADERLTPHFTVGQFLCKQSGNFPKYIVLQERLLLKLEHLLNRVNELGYATDSFHVMSGFRTPTYNRAIGNVAYSRHVWGDAADIFIDADGDGVMDDLNRDGRIDVHDAEVLFSLFDEEERHRTPHFMGGLGKYRANAAHGPFVHVDVRGTAARW